jgi:hypothetical protein
MGQCDVSRGLLAVAVMVVLQLPLLASSSPIYMRDPKQQELLGTHNKGVMLRMGQAPQVRRRRFTFAVVIMSYHGNKGTGFSRQRL